MKLTIKYLSFIVGLLFITSCDKNDELLVFDNVNGQTHIQLTENTATLATPSTGLSVQIEVQVSTISESARTISIQIQEDDLDNDILTTATTDQYTLSDITIPANSYSGTLTITSNYDAIPEEGSTYLFLELVSINSGVFTLEKEDLKIEFFRKCPIVLEDFVGTWSGTGSWSEHFDYSTRVETFINSEGEMMINGLALDWVEGWWGEIITTNKPVRIDIDVETGAFTIEEQPYITTTYNGSPQAPYSIKATGTILNPCQKTMKINPVLVQGGNDIDGTTWGSIFLETIKLD